MDEFVAIFWVVFVGAFAFVILRTMVQRSRALDETYQRFADRRAGQATPGGLFHRPTFRFDHHGAPVLVDIYSTGGKHPTYYTQVHVAWPDRTTRCEVYPERFSSRLGKMLGMMDVEIGSPKFDRDFIVTGNSPRALRELLTPEVQEAIYRLWALGRNSQVYVSIGGGKMLVKKQGLLRDDASLSRLIDAALDLYDRATARSSEGIEIIASSEMTQPTQAVCQVCGESVAEAPVYCRRCRTPHHEDCWEYFGGCSTFGCGERRTAKSHGPPH